MNNRPEGDVKLNNKGIGKLSVDLPNLKGVTISIVNKEDETTSNCGSDFEEDNTDVRIVAEVQSPQVEVA